MTMRARILLSAAIVCLPPLSFNPRAAQRSSAIVVHVWKVGSPHRGDTPVPSIPPLLDAEAQRRGFALDMRVFQAKDFASAFFAARITNDEPDILVVDNMGHIEGITTPLGSFQGIGSDPNVAAVLVRVSDSLKAFQPTPWEYLIRTSKHYAEAKALATRPIACGSSGPEGIGSGLSKTAEQAVIAYFENASNTFADLVSGDPADTAIHLPHEPRSITDVHVCDGWGNDRIAFVQAIASFEARDEVGYRTFLAAVASVDDRPRVLMLGDSNGIIPVLQSEAPPFHNEAPAAVLLPPIITTPDDGATATRMPRASRPMVSWKSRDAAFSLVEWQYGQGKGEDWEGSEFAFVPTDAGTYSDLASVAIQAPFGVGRQPHRFRIWVFSARGDVARSEWRTLFYTN
jgi:hypothetical protein